MAVKDHIAPSLQEPMRVTLRNNRSTWLFSLGAIVAGLAGASCCVVPFVLFLAGIGGAWIGNLTALEPYRFYFASAAIACIGYGFYRVHRTPAVSCAEGSYCARPISRRTAKIGLWAASAIALIAIASPYLIAYLL